MHAIAFLIGNRRAINRLPVHFYIARLAVHINIQQSNTYRKDLSWLHFDDDPRAQERQQVKDQQFYIFVFAAYPVIPSSNYVYEQPGAWQIYRDTEQPRKKEISQKESRLQFSQRQFQQQRQTAPVQIRRESQPQHSKR